MKYLKIFTDFLDVARQEPGNLETFLSLMERGKREEAR